MMRDDLERAERAAFERPAVLRLNTWAGLVSVRVTVIDETPKKYRVRFEEACRLPNGIDAQPGKVRLVPKGAVTMATPKPEEKTCGDYGCTLPAAHDDDHTLPPPEPTHDD